MKLPGSRLFQEVVTSEYKDFYVGECLQLSKRLIKCHEQEKSGRKWEQEDIQS